MAGIKEFFFNLECFFSIYPYGSFPQFCEQSLEEHLQNYECQHHSNLSVSRNHSGRAGSGEGNYYDPLGLGKCPWVFIFNNFLQVILIQVMSGPFSNGRIQDRNSVLRNLCFIGAGRIPSLIYRSRCEIGILKHLIHFPFALRTLTCGTCG